MNAELKNMTPEVNQEYSDIKVMVQATPNPLAYKFIVNRDVKTQGRATYMSIGECVNNPLAAALFMADGVAQVHFFENVITVTFKVDTNLMQSETEIIDFIQQHMPEHDPNFKTEIDESERRAQLSPDLQKIEEILDRTIRPGLQGDGGDIEIISLIESELAIRYQGACGSCPSSTQGTLMAIESILRDEFDPDLRVIPV